MKTNPNTINDIPRETQTVQLQLDVYYLPDNKIFFDVDTRNIGFIFENLFLFLLK